MAAKRAVLRIKLEEGAIERIEHICERRGMTQIAVMSRIVNWLSTQDDFIQTSVLGALSDESVSALAISLLMKLSEKKRA